MFYYKMTDITIKQGNSTIYDYSPFKTSDFKSPVYNHNEEEVVFITDIDVNGQLGLIKLTETEYNDVVEQYNTEKPTPPPPPLSNEELTEESSLTSEYMVDLDFRLSNIELGL